jgi:hypothetical protein
MAPQTPEELAAAVAEDGIDFLFVMFVDLHGKPCAKLVPVSALEQMLDGGAGFAGYAAGPMGQTPADPDLIAIPDISSSTPMPWRGPRDPHDVDYYAGVKRAEFAEYHAEVSPGKSAVTSPRDHPFVE